MSDATALPLDSTTLRNRMVRAGFRQWWIAEQIGVDRRTVLRWANGQVRGIQPAHLDRLAAVLGCARSDLLLTRPEAALATPDDQRAAGVALAATRLLDRLGPTHDWVIAERLIKASAVPDLPLDVLGALYLQLAEACWRQDKLDEAATRVDAALAIAQRSGDAALDARALGQRALLRFWRGDVGAAFDDWRAALAQAEWLQPRDRASLHSNFGASLVETGHVDEGRCELTLARDGLDDGGTSMQLSIVHAHLALAALDAGEVETAAREAMASEAHARRGDYRRGVAFAALLRALVASACGDEGAMHAAISEGRRAFDALGIREALNHRLAARALRQLADRARRSSADEARTLLTAARAQLDTARPLADGFPLEHAEVQAEAAHVALRLGNPDEARAHAQAATALFERCHAQPKVDALRAAMSPHVTWP